MNTFHLPSRSGTSDGGAARSARVLLLGFVLVYGLLVATHRGEFWPFSIYPMFSSAGKPWTRVLVREVPEDIPDSLLWGRRSLDALPGRVLPLRDTGVSQNDLSVFLERTNTWTAERRRVLTDLLRPHAIEGRGLLVVRIRGRLTEAGGVVVDAAPVALVTSTEFETGPQR